jgi:hypothetical protein
VYRLLVEKPEEKRPLRGTGLFWLRIGIAGELL